LFNELTIAARKLGARIVVGHGETVVEPVIPGTNLAALEAGVDILAHPGFITEDEARLAASKGVLLELSGRKGHSLTNGHVAKMAARVGAKLAVNADAHGPSDFLTSSMAQTVALGAGVSQEGYAMIRQNMMDLVARVCAKR
ncbi:MAG: histidinol phosphate phosphatase domain-containing protein, partial [Desulfobulbaceae bacterium]|nr:histidinol phosphate phosphatase domain-containing protein [Desulfobulbaceae bacterium]